MNETPGLDDKKNNEENEISKELVLDNKENNKKKDLVEEEPVLDDIKMNRCKIINEKLNIKEHLSPIIFVYSLPKVGSTSLVSSLRIFGTSCFNIIHVHDENMLQTLLHENDIYINDVILYNKIIGKEVIVIDIFREPIERKISAFFEKISWHFNTAEENIKKYSIDTLIQRFNLIFPNIPDYDPFTEKYNIPVPSQFDFKQKYLLVSHNSIKYIKLRLTDSEHWGTILSSVLNHTINIVKDYETSNKTIHNIYKQFKDKYLIPVNYLDDITHNTPFQYYMNSTEKEIYIKKWRAKETSKFSPFSPEQSKLYMTISNMNNLEDKIQLNHYRDQGCTCKACCIKRWSLQKKILSGSITDEKIFHDECVFEYIQQKTKLAQRLVKNNNKNHNQLHNRRFF